jgi:uncharacterized membrane protein
MLLRWFPAVPGWDGVHPAMVHFPVALLLVAPVLLAISLFMRQSWRGWAWSALVVMVLGTFAAWLAAGSGHAAAQLVDKIQGLESPIGRHEALGLATRNLFTALTLLYALVMLVPLMLKLKVPPVWRITLHAVFLALWIGGAGLLATTADAGGRLVHQFGIRAMVLPPGQNPAEPAPATAADATRRGTLPVPR